MLTKEKILNEAMSQAEKFIKYKNDNVVDKSKSLTISQLRRFFDQVKRLERRYKTSSKAFEKISYELALIVASAKYTLARGKIPVSFLDFLETQIKNINSGKEFEDFVKYFEAVVGYYYFIAKQKGLKIE